jgi:hypothetical protein
VSDAEAIERAQQFLLARSRRREAVRRARLIVAHSSDSLDPDLEEDHWAVTFDIPLKGFDPTFFVLHVNNRTGEVTDFPALWSCFSCRVTEPETLANTVRG